MRKRAVLALRRQGLTKQSRRWALLYTVAVMLVACLQS